MHCWCWADNTDKLCPAGQGTAPEHLLDLRRLPAHSQLDQSRNHPYLLSHLLVVALPCQFVLVLGSLQKTKQNTQIRQLKNSLLLMEMRFRRKKSQIKWENPHKQQIILDLNVNRAKYPHSAPKTLLCWEISTVWFHFMGTDVKTKSKVSWPTERDFSRKKVFMF